MAPYVDDERRCVRVFLEEHGSDSLGQNLVGTYKPRFLCPISDPTCSPRAEAACDSGQKERFARDWNRDGSCRCERDDWEPFPMMTCEIRRMWSQSRCSAPGKACGWGVDEGIGIEGERLAFDVGICGDGWNVVTTPHTRSSSGQAPQARARSSSVRRWCSVIVHDVLDRRGEEAGS